MNWESLQKTSKLRFGRWLVAILLAALATTLVSVGFTQEKGGPVQVTIKDDWNVAGLRGTGSCSIVARDMFVPKHRFLSLPAAIEGHASGATLHDGTLFRSAAVHERCFPVFGSRPETLCQVVMR